MQKSRSSAHGVSHAAVFFFNERFCLPHRVATNWVTNWPVIRVATRSEKISSISIVPPGPFLRFGFIYYTFDIIIRHSRARVCDVRRDPSGQLRYAAQISTVCKSVLYKLFCDYRRKLCLEYEIRFIERGRVCVKGARVCKKGI